ncbi:MAG: TIGR03905 family TSCPD domain-containing protein [Lachnospiraceae bacterium]|nr:TIGR03905 family TSCPD domain-containing protein [Lachnospiraceae bacterium]
MTHTYQTKGTCSKQITFDLNDGVVSNVSYLGGCNGNLQGVAKLVEGQKAEDLIAKLKGIQCGLKGTSCPDQLARALEEAIAGRI